MRDRHSSSLPQPSALLRGIANHVQTHALAYPPRPTSRRERAPTLTAAEVCAPTYEEGLAEGFSRGVEEGRLRAEAESQTHASAAWEQAREEAAAEGFAAGLAKGEGEARAVALKLQDALRAEGRAQLARLDGLITRASAEIKKVFELGEDEFVALAHETVCKILGQTATSAKAVASLVASVLASQGGRRRLQLHLHPHDVSLLLEADPEFGKRESLVPDENIRLGGVVLRSPDGDLDVRLDTQLRALTDSLLAIRRRRAIVVPAVTEEAD
jgi:flagellar biosynthesis/type III secretory pathway protein FliH